MDDGRRVNDVSMQPKIMVFRPHGTSNIVRRGPVWLLNNYFGNRDYWWILVVTCRNTQRRWLQHREAGSTRLAARLPCSIAETVIRRCLCADRKAPLAAQQNSGHLPGRHRPAQECRQLVPWLGTSPPTPLMRCCGPQWTTLITNRMQSVSVGAISVRASRVQKTNIHAGQAIRELSVRICHVIPLITTAIRNSITQRAAYTCEHRDRPWRRGRG